MEKKIYYKNNWLNQHLNRVGMLDKTSEQNMDKNNEKLHGSDVINSNLVDGKLDAVGALQQIFDEECAKAVLKGIIQQSIK